MNFQRPLVLAFVLCALVTTSASVESVRCVTVRISPPYEAEAYDYRTKEGRRSLQVQLPTDGDFQTFFLDLFVIDPSAVVRVTLRDGVTSDSSVLGEWKMDIGGQGLLTSTSPSFGIAIVAVDESLNGVCAVSR